MKPTLPKVQALARALLKSERTEAGVEAAVGACERVLQRLSEGMTPLVGAGGFFLLLERALKRTRGDYKWLDAVQIERESPWRLPGAVDAAQEVEVEEVGAAAEAVLTELIGLIARFLGADMAIRLARQSFPENGGGRTRDRVPRRRTMNDERVKINTLPTGVPGLDRVLGGGLPEYSFNLIAGATGTGKTTLSQQIMYANASHERPVLHFTVLGEPPLKMLRYQQQFGFFDATQVEGTIRYRNLSEEVLSGDLNRVLDAIVSEVDRAGPEIVVVDSFRTVVRSAGAENGGEIAVQEFLQRLGLHLASWEATSFLIGEYLEAEMGDNPVFTVADGILWLSQQTERNTTLRKLQVIKVRGQARMPGLHTFRITDQGLRVFPRTDVSMVAGEEPRPSGRLSTGVEGLDELLNGGIPAGDSALIAGPSGSGKTVLGTHFVAEGVRRGEKAVIAVFEEHPEAYVARAETLGMDVGNMVERGDLRIIYLRPLDLSADEALQEIQDAVQEMGASRVVIDSLSGFEIALTQTFREEFRESLYRMVAALTRARVTVLMTVEVTEEYTSLRFSPHAISFLTDDLIMQRYIELEGQLRRVLTVVKMRGSDHSKDWRAYEVTDEGLLVGPVLSQYRGIIGGIPVPREEPHGGAVLDVVGTYPMLYRGGT